MCGIFSPLTEYFNLFLTLFFDYFKQSIGVSRYYYCYFSCTMRVRSKKKIIFSAYDSICVYVLCSNFVQLILLLFCFSFLNNNETRIKRRKMSANDLTRVWEFVAWFICLHLFHIILPIGKCFYCFGRCSFNRYVFQVWFKHLRLSQLMQSRK